MKTVWVNGCFDVIHVGHIDLLEYAKSAGNRLVVGIDTDRRVKSFKGNDRPINNQQMRMKVLSALRCVDEVVLFSSDSELVEKIRASRAELIVVGSDYIDKNVIGSDVCPVQFFQKVPDISSTSIIEALSKK